MLVKTEVKSQQEVKHNHSQPSWRNEPQLIWNQAWSCLWWVGIQCPM